MSLFPLLFLAFWACGGSLDLKDHSDPKEVRGQLFHSVPIGSSLEAAKGTLAQLGFQCGTVRSSEFPSPTAAEVVCDKLRDDGVWTPVRWQVALLVADGKVTDLQVSPGLVGP